ncbi:MAG TPA: universal stress protein [Gaiellaceae bacterium]|nr:universal stress protein [Gaiellaceae bacterium]
MESAPILICYDGSESARRAIDAAATLFGHRHAVVLDLGPPLTPAESVAAISPVVPGAAFEDMNEADALTRAEDGAARAEQAGFHAVARSGISAPTWEGICDVADEIAAPVIVVGSRALTPGREFVEGSVAHDVARHAGRPVLVVPPPHGAA